MDHVPAHDLDRPAPGPDDACTLNRGAPVRTWPFNAVVCALLMFLANGCGGSGGAMDAGTDPGITTDVPIPEDPGTGDVSPLDTPVTDTPAQDVPATDVPMVDTPAPDVPAEDAPDADAPAEDLPATDLPAQDVPEVDTPHVPVTSVLLVGDHQNGPTYVASQWKDGILTNLSVPGNNGGAYGVQVVDGVVYTTGFYNAGAYDVGTVWTDGVQRDLGEYDHGSFPKAILVSNGDVRVVGACKTDVGAGVIKDRATLWTNWVPAELASPPGIRSYANAVVEYAGVVYVAGFYNDGAGRNVATIWEDGVRTDLLPAAADQSSYGTSVSVSNGVAYVAGYTEAAGVRTATVWRKDGATIERFALADAGQGSHAYGVTVIDGLVHVAGHYSDGTNSIAAVWINYVKKDLTLAGRDAFAFAVQVVDGSVYVGGYIDNGTQNVACYWKDDERIDVPPPAGGNASAYGMFVDVR